MYICIRYSQRILQLPSIYPAVIQIPVSANIFPKWMDRFSPFSYISISDSPLLLFSPFTSYSRRRIESCAVCLSRNVQLVSRVQAMSQKSRKKTRPIQPLAASLVVATFIWQSDLNARVLLLPETFLLSSNISSLLPHLFVILFCFVFVLFSL